MTDFQSLGPTLVLPDIPLKMGAAVGYSRSKVALNPASVCVCYNFRSGLNWKEAGLSLRFLKDISTPIQES